MSERMTSITLPGVWGAGYAVHGKSSVADMIGLIRAHAAAGRGMADAVLSAADADFLVESYVGVNVRRDRIVLQAPPSEGDAAQEKKAPFGGLSWKCAALTSTDPPQDCDWPYCGCDERSQEAMRIATDHAREVVAKWMLAHSIATGHGDTIEDLLGEIAAHMDRSRPSQGNDPGASDSSS